MIAMATAYATTAFALVQRASATARPMPDRVSATLDHYDRTNTAIIVRPAKVPSRRALDRATKTEAEARVKSTAVLVEIDAVNAKISDLLRAQRRRRSPMWLRMFPDGDTDAAVEALRQERAELQQHHAFLQVIHLRAVAAEEVARREHARAVAWAGTDRQAEVMDCRRRSEILARARALLARVPALAYVGAKRLLGMATRVEAARKNRYDEGFSAPDIKVG